MDPRRAKIVCTLGPALDGPGRIAELVNAGMDVARLNFSHGSPDDHRRRADQVRAAADAAGRPVALLADLCGPKIRAGVGLPAAVEAGRRVALRGTDDGGGEVLAVQYPSLAEDLRPGDRVLLGDGEIELVIVGAADGGLEAEVLHGGLLRDRMGVNLPAGRVRTPAFTSKDEVDLRHALALGVDWVALSFVRSAGDVLALRDRIRAAGADVPILAKIETPQAVEELDAVTRAADALMVARGDLGVELPPERVPIVQRQILAAARIHQKPAIVATEMLHSMVRSPRPTRAEASDVANAVFDGADAVMLSAETASGSHPVVACRMMARLIEAAERSPYYAPARSDPDSSAAEAIATAACDVARTVGARLIAALTFSGETASLVSKARPPVPIVALSPAVGTLRRLALSWGVIPRHLPVHLGVDDLAERVGAALLEGGFAAQGDRYVLVCGLPLGGRSGTNAILVETVR